MTYVSGEETNAVHRVIKEDDEMVQVERLYLLDNHVNSLANWKSKLLDVQALVSRIYLPHLCITVTMETKWDVLKNLGLDIQNSSKLIPAGDTPRLFDTPNITARVYNQFTNTVWKDPMENLEQYFCTKWLGFAGKLEFQAPNTPHHHILFFLQGAVIDNLTKIHDIISAELQMAEQDRELLELLKRCYRHRYSQYC